MSSSKCLLKKPSQNEGEYISHLSVRTLFKNRSQEYWYVENFWTRPLGASANIILMRLSQVMTNIPTVEAVIKYNL